MSTHYQEPFIFLASPWVRQSACLFKDKPQGTAFPPRRHRRAKQERPIVVKRGERDAKKPAPYRFDEVGKFSGDVKPEFSEPGIRDDDAGFILNEPMRPGCFPGPFLSDDEDCFCLHYSESKA